MQSSNTYKSLQEDNPCQQSRKKNHCKSLMTKLCLIVWQIIFTGHSCDPYGLFNRVMSCIFLYCEHLVKRITYW